MSHLNFSVSNDAENQPYNRNAKQFGASQVSRSTTKKSALTDVKNILAQRTAQSTKKTQISTTKGSIFKKNLFGVSNDKENNFNKQEMKTDVDVSKAKESNSTSSTVVSKDQTDCDEALRHIVCSFCNKTEDDNADMLMKSIITLTKGQIDALAMGWERKPAVSLNDIREIEIPPAIPDEIFQKIELVYEEDCLLNDIPLFDFEEPEE